MSELTTEEIQAMTNAELAMVVVASAIGCGNREIARVLREAANRLHAPPPAPPKGGSK